MAADEMVAYNNILAGQSASLTNVAGFFVILVCHFFLQRKYSQSEPRGSRQRCAFQ
jgi:hypothetical protein